MPTPAPERIRTVAVVGHSHDGKTTMCEALLHTAGATQRMGSTDQGSSILDFEPEEQRRSISISAAVAHCEWKGTEVYLIDAPGFQDFAGEVASALAGADAAVLVVGATGTVPVGAELAWEMIKAAGLPCLIVVNRMDRENAAYEATVDALREAFGRKPIAVVVPIGAAQVLLRLRGPDRWHRLSLRRSRRRRGHRGPGVHARGGGTGRHRSHRRRRRDRRHPPGAVPGGRGAE